MQHHFRHSSFYLPLPLPTERSAATKMSHSIPNYNNPGHQSRAASSSSILSQIPPPLNGLSSTKRDSINSIQNQNRVPSAAGGIGAGQPQSSLHQQLFQRSEVRVEDGILDRPLNRTRGAEVGMATWAFLFAEIVSYSQSRSDSVDDLEKRSVMCPLYPL